MTATMKISTLPLGPIGSVASWLEILIDIIRPTYTGICYIQMERSQWENLIHPFCRNVALSFLCRSRYKLLNSYKYL